MAKFRVTISAVVDAQEPEVIDGLREKIPATAQMVIAEAFEGNEAVTELTTDVEELDKKGKSL